MKVTKRNGQSQELDVTKLQRQTAWACNGLKASPSEVEMASKLKMYEGIKTEDIHEELVKAAVSLIVPWEPDYAVVAGRLNIHRFRKEAYNDITPPPVQVHVKKMVEMGMYDSEILKVFSDKDFEELDEIVDHNRDFDLHYAATEQYKDKYLVQVRSDKDRKVLETPQMATLLICATLFSRYPKSTRMFYIKEAYDAVSLGYISLPTPIMAGVRTPSRQFASCVLIESDDSLKSINATASAIVEYVSKRAGIGIGGGAIRAFGSKIGLGEVKHTGVIPFWKYFSAATKSCSQGGVRGGAATVYYPMWHREAKNLFVLKNNRGAEETRLRTLDYGVQTSAFFIKRYQTKGKITLFSPDVAEGRLYKLFYEDSKAFEALYEELEKDPSIEKIEVPAEELWTSLVNERAETGRIYIHFVDVSIKSVPFDPKKAPVRMSNLCAEILLPTKPLGSVTDPDGEIALCTLAALNWGKVKYEKVGFYMDLAVRMLDSLLSYQNYMLPAAKRFTDQFRALGIGAIGYAHYLTKNGWKYGEALSETRAMAEAMQYFGLKTSVQLAKEYGRCDGFDRLKYAEGWLKADDVPESEKKMDWEGLRSEIKEHGLRNATVLAFMPSETSSQISNETNGLEPPRELITVKKSKTGILKQVVPEVLKLGMSYQTCWDVAEDNRKYIDSVAEIMKFTCQSASANTYYVPHKFEGGKVPVAIILRDLFYARQKKLPTLYYHNTHDGSGENTSEVGCESGACAI